MISNVAVLLWKLLFSDAPEVDMPIMISQAWIESRFDVTAVSRRVGDHREGGAWKGPFPDHWEGPFFCGPWQTRALTETECVAQQNVFVALEKRQDILKSWLRFCHDDLTCALNGYACGVRGARTGRCNHYAERVLYRARSIELGSTGSANKPSL